MRILGHDFEVRWMRPAEGLESSGRANDRYQWIEIVEGLPAQQEEATMLHEVIEMVNALLRLELKHTQIFGLETGLFQVLSENGVDISPLLRELPKGVA